LLSILYGLSSAVMWGAADFCGGIASRKSRAYQAVLYGEAFGLLILLIGALFISEPTLSLASFLICSLAGAMGVLGLLLFFLSFVQGQMSVAAPVSALTATFLPVIVGSILEGFPGLTTFAGFALALVAIWLISQPDGGSKNLRLRLKDLALPLIAGVSFGFYLVLIHQGSQEAIFWPLVAARTGGVLTMLIYALVGRRQFLAPAKAWPFFILNGILDVSGNGLYILSGQSGRMDVAAVLASLYPASTVLLAFFVLHEKINRPQFIGILTALGAIVLITI
jgi:drug/metabolite transporter (DMT)-like permease